MHWEQRSTAGYAVNDSTAQLYNDYASIRPNTGAISGCLSTGKAIGGVDGQVRGGTLSTAPYIPTVPTEDGRNRPSAGRRLPTYAQAALARGTRDARPRMDREYSVRARRR